MFNLTRNYISRILLVILGILFLFGQSFDHFLNPKLFPILSCNVTPRRVSHKTNNMAPLIKSLLSYSLHLNFDKFIILILIIFQCNSSLFKIIKDFYEITDSTD